MEGVFRRVGMFVLGIVLGYCTGFNDATENDVMVHIRMIHRIQNFAERTVGDRQRAAEEMVESIEP